MNPTDLGHAFSEDLKERIGESRGFTPTRLRIFWIFFVATFGVLFLRLVGLQLLEGERNRILSDENRIQARRIQAPRGVISDRNGEVLVQNVPVYKILNENCLNEGSSTAVDSDEHCPELIEISREEALRREAEGREEALTFVGRHYLYGPEIAQVVGFVGEISREEMEENPDYGLGDLIGKMGVELAYEERLHGKYGAELVEVDAASEVIREISKRKPVNGQEVILTIDAGLQKKAYELLNSRKVGGALVALEPRTGEVLALVSYPSYDPNDVSVSLAREDQPFFNRAIAGLYPPGSIFKMVTAIAGLEEGKISANTEFEDTGEIRIGVYRYGNWYFDQYGRKEGFLNIVGAIKRSNDIFFYKVGQLVGATALSEWGKAFGFGSRSGIDLPREAVGLVPSPLWKERERGERWFLGNTFHFAIGQADLEVTPLQVARMTAAVANQGKLCRPQVVPGEEENCQELGIGEESLRLVQRGMVEACLPRGTGFPFFEFGIREDGEFRRIEVGCKTGTAEYGDPEGRTHAWFTVFAPVVDPQIVVTVLLEGAGEGSYQAAPVAKEFLEYYFREIADRR